MAQCWHRHSVAGIRHKSPEHRSLLRPFGARFLAIAQGKPLVVPDSHHSILLQTFHFHLRIGVSTLTFYTATIRPHSPSSLISMSDLEDEIGLDSSNHETGSDEQDWSHITKPGLNDVLLGRGGGTNNHSGNVKFRKLVNEHKLRYLACSKVEKPRVAREVVQLWRKMDPPGRFLARKDETKKGPGSVKDASNVWYEVGDKKAREKASQCLRERTPDVLPYIKQLRQQQDHFTEQGVNLVQQQLRLQEAHQQGVASAAFHPAQRSQSMSAAHLSFGRRNSMSAAVQQHIQPSRRCSMPAVPTPVTPNGQGGMYQQVRRGSMPVMSAHHEGNQFNQDQYYMQNYDLNQQDSYGLQQQQSLHMDNSHQQQWGYEQPHHPSLRQVTSSFDVMDDFEPLPVANGHGQTVMMQQMQQQQLHHVSPMAMHQRQAMPDIHRSGRLQYNQVQQHSVNLPSPVEVNEVTLEEYRKSLEEYISSNQIPTPAIMPEDDARLTPEMDMPHHNTWIQRLSEMPTEKEQVHRNPVWGNTSRDDAIVDIKDEVVWKQEQDARRYKVNHQQHQAENKSHLSGMSGNNSVFSDFSLENQPNTRESKMTMARQMGSNMSMMSELTDLSETVTHMQLGDLEV